MSTRSCIYVGQVRHRRLRPAEHVFDYRFFMMYLDLAEIGTLFDRFWLWSSERRNVASFFRKDHAGDATTPLDQTIRDLVEAKLGHRPAGPIRLLTHLRYFGYVMNPVSFYYCYDASGNHVEAVVSEVHNTPWGEEHCYVCDQRAGDNVMHRFAKTFHVSPFMPMNQEYRWRLPTPGERLAVHMENYEGGERVFSATMALQRRPITSAQLALSLARFPAVTAKVVAGIYWQALRLKLKGVPFYPHPRTLVGTVDASTKGGPA